MSEIRMSLEVDWRRMREGIIICEENELNACLYFLIHWFLRVDTTNYTSHVATGYAVSLYSCFNTPLCKYLVT